MRHALYRFDITSLDGEYSSIDSVTLRLYITTDSTVSLNGQVATLEVYQLAAANTNWVEGTKGNQTAATGEVTWNQLAHNQANWAGHPTLGASLAGTDYLTPLVASYTFDLTETANSHFDLVFTDVSFISDWIDGSNPGLFMKFTDEAPTSAAARIFPHSNEEANETGNYQPELIINYTPIPEPRPVLILLSFGAVAWFAHRRR